MTTATLDPAATITAAGRELVDELAKLAERGGPVDELPDSLGKPTARIRRQLTRARKAQAAEAEKATPDEPKPDTPAPAADTTKTALPATTPATPRTTIPIPTKPERASDDE